jgi:hypothetical protein
MKKAERQAKIQTYGWNCDCDACKFDYPLLREMNHYFTETELKAVRQLEFIEKTEDTGISLLPEVIENMMKTCCAQLMDIHKTCKDKENLYVRFDALALQHVLFSLLMFCCEPRIKIP